MSPSAWLASVLAAQVVHMSSAATIGIASETVMTGEDAIWDYSARVGVDLGNAYIFAQEWIKDPTDDSTITLTISDYDDAGEESGAMFAALEYGDFCGLNQPATAAVGPTWSSLMVQSAAVAAQLDIPVLGYGTSSPTLADRDKFPTFSRIISSDDYQGTALADLVNNFGWSKVGMLVENDDYTKALASAFAKTALELDIKIVSEKLFTVGSNLKAEMASLKASEARIFLLFATTTSDAMDVLVQADEAGLVGPSFAWLGCESWLATLSYYLANEVPAVSTKTKAILQGVIGTTPQSPDETAPLWTSFVTMFEALPLIDRFNFTMSDMDIYGYLGFDSILFMGQALDTHNQIEYYCAQGGTGTKPTLTGYRGGEAACPAPTLLEVIRSTTVTGLTGKILLSPTGERLQPYDVNNIKSATDPVVETIATIDAGVLTFNTGEAAKLTWAGGKKGKDAAPRDGPAPLRTDILSISNGAFTAMVVLACLCAALVIFFTGMNIKHRAVPLIRLSSPNINNVTLGGCMLACISVVLHGLDTSRVSDDAFGSVCSFQNMSLSISFTLVFGSLFAKTLRIRNIFNANKLKTKRISDAKLGMVIAGLVAVDVLLLTVWQLVSPPTLKLVMSGVIDDSALDFPFTTATASCGGEERDTFNSLMLLYKASVMILGCFLAFEVRNVHIKELNDSKLIAGCIYNVMLCSLLGLSMAYFVTDVEVVFIFTSMAILIMVMVTMIVLFGPKLMAIRSGQSELSMNSKHSAASRTTNNNITSEDAEELQNEEWEKLTGLVENMLSACVARSGQQLSTSAKTLLGSLKKLQADARSRVQTRSGTQGGSVAPAWGSTIGSVGPGVMPSGYGNNSVAPMPPSNNSVADQPVPPSSAKKEQQSSQKQAPASLVPGAVDEGDSVQIRVGNADAGNGAEPSQ